MQQRAEQPLPEMCSKVLPSGGQKGGEERLWRGRLAAFEISRKIGF